MHDDGILFKIEEHPVIRGKSISQVCNWERGGADPHPDRRDGSKRRAAARFVVTVCTLESEIEAARLRVALDPLVPRVGVEGREPIAKG